MDQVGDLKTFRIMGSPPVYPAPIYVWKFWDASVIATGTYSGSVQKRLNLGGNPAEGFTVPFRCDICDSFGNVVQVVPDTRVVNNPPTVVPSPTIVPNDQPFPFTTTITTKAYDLENASLKFYWYLGTNPVGGHDSTSQNFTTEGTYYGTLTGLTRNGYTNTFISTIEGSGTVFTCKIVDADSGTTALQFETRGFDPADPAFSVAATPESILANASTLPIQVIAPGQFVTFTGYGFDPTPGKLHFTWYFYGTNGWSQPGLPILYEDAGTAVAQGFKSEYRLQIGAETTAGLKTAIVSCNNLSTGRTVYSSIPARLELNTTPTITSVGLYDPLTAQAITQITKQALPTRTLVQFSGTASDVNLDAISYRWDIASMAPAAAYTLYGRDAYVDVSDWSAGVKSTIGVVYVTDRFGATSSAFSLPSLTIV